MTSHIFNERLNRLQTEMVKHKVDLVAIGPTANMRYLLGFAPHADERLTLLLVTPASSELLIPTLNADQVETHTGRQVIRWADDEGPAQALSQALDRIGIKPQSALAIDDSLRADAVLMLQAAVRPKQSVVAGQLMSALRLQKSAEEIEALVQAAALADKGILAGAEACRPGLTEREVATEIERCFRENGAENIDFMLVASGPNSAFPHHQTGGRRLERGDTIILDIGATLGGYKSDITRVVHLGEPSPEVRAVYEAVRAGNQRGREAVKPGIAARQVDRAARAAIEQAGYGDYFIHRTGHGLGLETHEPPQISSTGETILQAGMVFSVEPGVYLPGKFGVRIEDIVVVTADGCRRLTGLDHELIVKA